MWRSVPRHRSTPCGRPLKSYPSDPALAWQTQDPSVPLSARLFHLNHSHHSQPTVPRQCAAGGPHFFHTLTGLREQVDPVCDAESDPRGGLHECEHRGVNPYAGDQTADKAESTCPTRFLALVHDHLRSTINALPTEKEKNIERLLQHQKHSFGSEGSLSCF